MRLWRSPLLLLVVVVELFSWADALTRFISADSLSTCMTDSQLSASKLYASYFPDNQSVAFDISIQSLVSTNVSIDVDISAYGIEIKKVIDPCDMEISGFCPMQTGNIALSGSHTLTGEALSILDSIPSIAYTVPDLDAVVTINIYESDTNTQLACVRTTVQNGRSVYHRAVYWVMCMVIGIPLLIFLLISPVLQTPALWEIVETMITLFQFAQIQALYSMMATSLPAIIYSWGRNFMWSMGIIRIGFMQDVFTWYVKSTGGTPSTLVDLGIHANVALAKRGIDLGSLAKRATTTVTTSTSDSITLRGIKRISYMMGIETTNFFATGFSFFIILLFFSLLVAMASRFIVEMVLLASRNQALKKQRIRLYWKSISKGFFYRVIFVGFTQMSVLSMWEIYTRDSSALAFLSMYVIVDMAVLLCYAFVRTIQIIRKTGPYSHPDVLYNLYSDTQHLMRWGFMYVQLDVRFFYFTFPLLLITLVRSMFIGFGQDSPKVQGCAMFGISVVVFALMVILRPYATKHMNTLHIGVALMNLISGSFILVMCQAFYVEELARQVIGIIFFALNAITMLLLILGIFIRTLIVLFRKSGHGTYYRILDDQSEKATSYNKSIKDMSSSDMAFSDPAYSRTTLRSSVDLNTPEYPFSNRNDSDSTFTNNKYVSPWDAIEEASYANLRGNTDVEQPFMESDYTRISENNNNAERRRKPLPNNAFR